MIRQPNQFAHSFKSISRFRKIVGVVLGVGYAVILYAFQFLLRETLRIASTSEFNEMWLLSEEEVGFYNWFAAALSLLIGQSICLAYWFSRPKRFKERGIRSRSTIINDQRFLQTSFLMWFLKLGFFYVIFFGLTWQNNTGYLVFSFYPTFAIILILVILVLFFQSWNTIRVKFKQKSYKWMLFAFFALGLTSWAMSKINVVDYEAANESILAENIWYTYDLQLPEVDNWDEPLYYADYIEPYLYYRKTEDTAANAIWVRHDRRWRPAYDRDNYAGFSSSCTKPRDYSNTDIRLYIDKRIKMRIVSDILSDFRDKGAYHVSFAVLPLDAPYPPACYHGNVINTNIPFEYENQEDYLASKARWDSIPNQIQIKHDKMGECNVNGKAIKYEYLANELFELMIVNTDFFIEYIYSDELPFDDYIQFKVAANEAIIQVKDFFTWDERGKAYYELHWGNRESYDKEYPLRMRRVSESFLLAQ
ncbi:MAG: hypothetical protein GQ574_22545 [Crocinitomix sp.]|nr:hypothetical protein [Crocinitomix sp.]